MMMLVLAGVCALGALTAGWWTWRGRWDRSMAQSARRGALAIGLGGLAGAFAGVVEVAGAALYVLVLGGWSIALVLAWEGWRVRRALITSAVAAGVSASAARALYRRAPAGWFTVLGWWSGSVIVAALVFALALTVLPLPATVVYAPRWTLTLPGMAPVTWTWWFWLMSVGLTAGFVHGGVNELRRSLR